MRSSLHEWSSSSSSVQSWHLKMFICNQRPHVDPTALSSRTLDTASWKETPLGLLATCTPSAAHPVSSVSLRVFVAMGETTAWLGGHAGSDKRAECVCTGAGTCWCSLMCGFHCFEEEVEGLDGVTEWVCVMTKEIFKGGGRILGHGVHWMVDFLFGWRMIGSGSELKLFIGGTSWSFRFYCLYHPLI